jgi:GntR family transcriptional regulator, carbon starvation induced regulator
MSTETNLTGMAYEKLRSSLLYGNVKPGDRLNIATLCTDLSVSPGAVREALSRLISEGLVDFQQNRGFHARPISLADFTQLVTARASIDGLCLRSSIAAGDLEWEAGLIGAVHRLERRYAELDNSAQSMHTFALAHAAFHQALVAGCSNHWLLWMRGLLYAQSVRYRTFCLPLARKKADLYEYQGEFVTAVLQRNADRAVTLMEHHYGKAAKLIGDALQEAEAKGSLTHVRRERPARKAQVRRAAKSRMR